MGGTLQGLRQEMFVFKNREPITYLYAMGINPHGQNSKML